MKSLPMRRRIRHSAESGMTLLELIIACTILLILSSAGAADCALHGRSASERRNLRLDLRDMRNAIDRYKDMADQQKIRIELGSEGYPPDLETLVKGVAIGGAGAARKEYSFLAARFRWTQ